MSIRPLITAICRENGFSSKPRLPSPFLGNQPLEWPEIIDIHEILVKGAIERGTDFTILSPTLKHYYVEILTLSALFKLRLLSTERNRVLVLSSEPVVRKQFKELGPPTGAAWSHAEFPIGTVQYDDSVVQKTESYASEDAPPIALFSRHLHHLPSVEIGEKIGCVIYDESVNFKAGRWKRYRTWREESGIPAAVYCLRDPLGPVYQRTSDDKPVWAWPPALLQSVVGSTEPHVASDGEIAKDNRLNRVHDQLRNKTNGIAYDVHTISEGEPVERMEALWEQIEELQTIQDAIQASELDEGIRALKWTVSDFSNVIASIGFTEQCYNEQWELRTLSQSLDLLDYHYETIRGGDKSAPASGEYNNAIALLEDLYEDWEAFNKSETKEGHLHRLIQGSIEAGDTTAVVTPTEAARQALHLDLQARGGEVYTVLDEQLRLETPDTVPDADVADRVILYGPPYWKDRWLLRSSHAPEMTFIAYKHQLPLLSYQVNGLNKSLKRITDTPACRQAISAVSTEKTTAPAIDQIEIDVPRSGEESESEVAEGYEVVDGLAPTSVEEIIGEISGDYGESSGQRDRDTSRSSRNREPVRCYRINFENGQVMHVRPGDSLHVVTGEETTKKTASRLRPGDTIVTIQKTESLREQLYTLIKQQSDHKLIFHSELWKIKLKNAIEENDDSFNEFVERLRAAGIDHRKRTFRRWYNFEINHTQAYEDMEKIAEAYDLDVMKENLEDIWDASHKIETMYRRLLRELRNRAIRAVSKDTEDVVLSEEHDIRLSDFNMVDDKGDQIMKTLGVKDIKEDVEVEAYRIHRLE